MFSKKNKTEVFVFFLIALANAYPIYAHHFFPTLDGPSHLYNAHLIKELVFGNEFLKSFVQFNHFPVPNWIGHLIMGVLTIIFPAFIAEKVLLLSYLIGLPFAFRYLIKTLSPKNYLASYLIFPFCYSYMFFLGFYNFSIALIFLFFTLGYWVRIKDKLNYKRIFGLFVLITLTYFSHILIYGILFPTMLILLFIDETQKMIAKKEKILLYFQTLFYKVLVVFICFGVTGYSAFLLFSNKPMSSNEYLPKAEMLRNIKVIEPIIGFVQPDEAITTGKIFYVLIALTIIALLKRFINLHIRFRKTFKENIKELACVFNKYDFWIFLSGTMLLGYFVLPNSDGWAGYFSLRILLLFFLFYIVWLGLQNIHKYILLGAICITLFYGFKLISYRDKIISSLSQTAMQCYYPSKYIDNNSTVLTINRSENWLHSNFSKYLGTDKSVVILDNGECDQQYFPLVWNDKQLPKMIIDTSNSLSSCFPSKQISVSSNHIIDYIFIMGRLDTINNECDKKLFFYLKSNPLKIYSDEYVSLYKNKK